MIRFILCVIVVVGFLILSIPILLVEWIIGKFNPMAKEISSLRIVQAVFRFILWVAGVKLTVIGEENVPTDVPVLYIGNHRSFFDVPLTYPRCPIRTGYIAKKEMEKIPCLSHWMRFINCLFLDRKNIKAGLATMNEGTQLLKDGFSIAIFPEGTRNKGEELSLLPFKEGAFKIATKTGCPIVPISMNNTAEIFENHFPKIKKTHVVLEYGTPIYPNELDKDVKKHIGSYVENIVNETIHKNAELLKN